MREFCCLSLRWLKHITDAAESHKRDAAKGRRSAGQSGTVDSPTVHLGAVEEMLVVDRTARNNDDDVDDDDNNEKSVPVNLNLLRSYCRHAVLDKFQMKE